MNEPTSKKVERCIEWFMQQNEESQKRVLNGLFEYAILGEWVSIHDDQDIDWLVEEAVEDGEDPEVARKKYSAPYYSTCGENLDAI
tara:strand:+ start:754 stop:1011 length:258 start_codon:yes stop_codon:yes gene_type:complete